MSKRQVTIPIFIPHLGCPHKCIFCNQWTATSKHTLPDKDNINDKMNRYLSSISKKVKIVEAAFFGGSFTGLDVNIQQHLLGILKPFLMSGQIHGIRVSTRPDYIDNEILDLLWEYGVQTVELGIQSFNDSVLSAAGRGHGNEESFNALNLLRKKGFNIIIQLLPGLPGDSREGALQSATIAAEIKPQGVRIYPAVVLKNTKLAELYTSGKYIPLSIHEAVDLCSEMFGIFSEKEIPVIRMGLHPFSDKDRNSILAGPYHPAFGFLVKSRYRFKEMVKKTKTFSATNHKKDHITLLIPSCLKEEYIGIKKTNIVSLQQNFSHFSLDYRVYDGNFLQFL